MKPKKPKTIRVTEYEIDTMYSALVCWENQIKEMVKDEPSNEDYKFDLKNCRSLIKKLRKI